MNSNELKPCPFCGGEAKLEQHKIMGFNVIIHYVRCCLCGCSTAEYVEKSTATTMWNSRAGGEQ